MYTDILTRESRPASECAELQHTMLFLEMEDHDGEFDASGFGDGQRQVEK